MGDSIGTGDCYPCPRTNLSPMSSPAHIDVILAFLIGSEV